MAVPSEADYALMLGRLKGAMDFASHEIEDVKDSVHPALSEADAAKIKERLLLLLTHVTFRVGNDPNDPVPVDLPSLA